MQCTCAFPCGGTTDGCPSAPLSVTNPHEQYIARLDQMIAYLEQQVNKYQEQRREYINRHNLNKVKPV